MKRSLKAVRFSGFAFLVIRTNYRFFIPHEECPFLLAHLQSSVFKLSKDLIDSIHEEGIVAYTS